MTISSRIKEIRENRELNRTEFGQLIGVDSKRLTNMEQGLQRVHDDVIEAIVSKWPEHAYWLVTGKEITEAGQVSPMTEKQRRESKTA